MSSERATEATPSVTSAEWPPRDADIHEALQRAYRNGSWGKYHGPNCDALREQLAEYHETEFVRLTCSGTAGVELGLAALGVEPGDEVLLAGYDFPGNFRAIEHFGARPVLVDVDLDLRLGPEQLQAARSPKTRAVIISHLHGSLTEAARVRSWCADHQILMLEDACQAPGALIDDRLAGTWGDVGVHSFGGSKLLTAGRGGAVITNDKAAYQRMKVYAERGNDAYPISELQAAVLIPQLKKLDGLNEQRQRAAVLLASELAVADSLRLIAAKSLRQASCYKLAIALSPELLETHTRESWIAAAQRLGVPIDIGFRSFAKRSERRCRRSGPLVNSVRAGEAIAVLHHPILLTPETNIRQLALALRQVSARQA